MMTPAQLRDHVLGLAELGVIGGAVYDALIATTAVSHGCELLTCDERAVPTYERVGCDFRLFA